MAFAFAFLFPDAAALLGLPAPPDACPMSPRLAEFPFVLFSSREDTSTGTAVRGVMGDVGGRASGAELMECAARLCECEADLLTGAFAVRMFVKVTVTAKLSPAKKADCAGSTVTRIAESKSAV